MIQMNQQLLSQIMFKDFFPFLNGAQIKIYIYSSELGAGIEVKHLAINSASSWRALAACAFFNIFLRLRPRFPVVLNLRIFSRLRLIFSFLALTRHPSRDVQIEGAADFRPKAGIVKACAESATRAIMKRANSRDTIVYFIEERDEVR